ncbi:hypothetical protein DPMN_161893 [Dreissena polymorpha]|uniref:Uncharacterized protein n=1 Tax=Dreissena polymorpha TaxID=45954 RepID=A0A9D4ERA0_DREPO|nr:hypothetical protein DPMN_161893 [Dreissena polymorpha]
MGQAPPPRKNQTSTENNTTENQRVQRYRPRRERMKQTNLQTLTQAHITDWKLECENTL